MKNIPPIKALILARSPEIQKTSAKLLESHFHHHVTLTYSENLQDAIEAAEQKTRIPELVILEQRSNSVSLLKLFLGLSPETVFYVICADDVIAKDLKELPGNLHVLIAATFDSELLSLIKIDERVGKLRQVNAEPDSYVALTQKSILELPKLPCDIYVQLPSGKHVKIFRQGDSLTAADIQKYSADKNSQFFLTIEASQSLLNSQVEELENLMNSEPIDVEQAKRSANISHDVIRSLVENVGFSKEAQQIAKASVAMSIRLMGARPKLKNILTELQNKKNNFVASHSFVLGQVACAMAFTVGWDSASTYLKLTMAAFLHDIALNVPTFEDEDTIDEMIVKEKYTEEEIKMIKLHSAKAAEYAQQISEISSDVELIVAQHHEYPDGSGYPRGLTSKQISPLAAMFMIAHRLVIFSLQNPQKKPAEFYDSLPEAFMQGQFRRLISLLKQESTTHS